MNRQLSRLNAIKAPVCIVLLTALLMACAGNKPYQLQFSPPPEVLGSEEVSPFSDASEVNAPQDPQILYATLREPAQTDDVDEYYNNQRSSEVRLGTGRIMLGRSDLTWDEARKMALLKSGTDKYPLQVGEVTEFGVLDKTLHPMVSNEAVTQRDPIPRERFTKAINDRLAKSTSKDVFIYVHGYRVNFENPLLVASELWHFLGYRGVFIPFAWPSNRGRLAYFGDTENARYSAPYFRDFVQYLATDTNVERIHIIGYSAGTRLVTAAMHDLTLLYRDLPDGEIRERLKLGNVILVGSDVDRGIFGTMVLDGLLRMQNRFTIYQSPKDKALGMARFSFGRERTGQLDLKDLSPEVRAFLRSSDQLSLVDVEGAANFDAGKGHSYFRDSPWVSSDLLATILYSFAPAERGLVQAGDSPVWSFPSDYIQRLKSAIYTADPDLARRAERLSQSVEGAENPPAAPGPSAP